MGKVIMSGIVPPLVAPSTFPPIGTAMNDMTWEQIRTISDAGLAEDYFNLGDTKTITINGKAGATTISNLSVDVFIIGFNHNSVKEGNNKIHFQIGKISGNDVCLIDGNYGSKTSTIGAFTMNTSNTNSGGWSNSQMRKTVLGSDSSPTSPRTNTLLSCLPSDLRAVMKPITKYSDNTGGGSSTASNFTDTTDYLPLLSEFEVHGVNYYGNGFENNFQAQYDYYKAGNSTKKYRHNNTEVAAIWLLRTVYAYWDGTDTFCSVNGGGNPSSNNASLSGGVSPCFCV